MQGDSLIFSLFKFIIKFCKIIAIIHCLHLETVCKNSIEKSSYICPY